MNELNDSLLEIAINVMKKKKNPQTLENIQSEVFAKKGLSLDDEKVLAQFEVDFMLSGQFIYCGEDKNGNQIWDLKERQPSSLLDKDAGIINDIYEDDEDVIKNELKDDTVYDGKNIDGYINDDEIEDKPEDEDDIEEELGLVSDDEETREIDASQLDSENEEEDEEDEEDDIEIELRKRK